MSLGDLYCLQLPRCSLLPSSLSHRSSTQVSRVRYLPLDTSSAVGTVALVVPTLRRLCEKDPLVGTGTSTVELKVQNRTQIGDDEEIEANTDS